MRQPALFLSVRPTFAQRILSGAKTIELRRVRPNVATGQPVLIYSSSPVMALLASARIDFIFSGNPCDLWDSVRHEAGVTRDEYDAYFDGAVVAVGIRLAAVKRLTNPIRLEELRQRWPWFKPPQSYRYVEAQIEHNGGLVASLAPAG